MALDSEKIRWASITEVDPSTNLPNKTDPPAEFKNTGAKNNQPVARQWINNQFNEIYNAFVEMQQQVDAIVGGSSQPTLEIIYPVDSLFMSFSETNPASYLGFGTWLAIEGRTLVGVDTGDTDFDTPLETGGTKDHTHTENFSVDGHILTEAEMPAHTHTVDTDAGSTSTVGDQVRSENNTTNTSTTSSTGGGLSHTHGLSGGLQSTSNLPPYISVFMFRRTA